MRKRKAKLSRNLCPSAPYDIFIFITFFFFVIKAWVIRDAGAIEGQGGPTGTKGHRRPHSANKKRHEGHLLSLPPPRHSCECLRIISDSFSSNNVSPPIPEAIFKWFFDEPSARKHKTMLFA